MIKGTVIALMMLEEIWSFVLRNQDLELMNTQEHFRSFQSLDFIQIAVCSRHVSITIQHVLLSVFRLLIAYKSRIQFDVFILGQHDYFIHDVTFYASKDCKASDTAFIHTEVYTTDISSTSFHYFFNNGTIYTTKSLSFCKDLLSGREYLLSQFICFIVSTSDFIEKCPNSTQISLPFPVWNSTGVVSYQYGIA